MSVSVTLPSSTGPLQIISLFGKDKQNVTTNEQNNYTVVGALLLSGNYMTDWWEMAFSIFIWMAISYSMLYIGAVIVAFLMMRKHPYVFLVFIPMLAMCVLGPATIGAVTSMSLAFTLSSSDKEVSPWHCMVLGVFQSLIVVVVSFSRLLGTL